MKIFRTILFVIGSLLIFLTAISYLGANTGTPHDLSGVNKIAYLVGRNIGFIVGGILLFLRCNTQ